MTSDDQRSRSVAWDTVGRFLEQTNSVGQDMSGRNLDLWKKISGHLRADKYSANDMADDSATIVTAAMDNFADIWKMWAALPRQNITAAPLPTVVLIFGRSGSGPFNIAEPILIDANYDGGSRRDLPAEARIELAGNGAITQASADLLKQSIRVRRDEPSSIYVVETINESVGKKVTGFDVGYYEGLIYVVGPTIALASLRVVVTDDLQAPTEAPVPPSTGPAPEESVAPQ